MTSFLIRCSILLDKYYNHFIDSKCFTEQILWSLSICFFFKHPFQILFLKFANLWPKGPLSHPCWVLPYIVFSSWVLWSTFLHCSPHKKSCWVLDTLKNKKSLCFWHVKELGSSGSQALPGDNYSPFLLQCNPYNSKVLFFELLKLWGFF